MSTRHLAEVPPSDWRARASCLDVDPGLFFPSSNPDSATYQVDVAEARAICATCPTAVRERCLQFALDNKATGMWAGMDDHERVLLARRQNRPSEAKVRPADLCPWPGQDRGVERHLKAAADPCGMCAALVERAAARVRLHAQVIELAAGGMSNPQIGRTVGLHRDTVRRILRDAEARAAYAGSRP